MAEGKAKYINDCVSVIEERVKRLKAELASDLGQTQSDTTKAADRAAIHEAEHLAMLIRTLAKAPYKRSPYDVARGRAGFGPDAG